MGGGEGGAGVPEGGGGQWQSHDTLAGNLKPRAVFDIVLGR